MQIYDTTLRDGTQGEGFQLSVSDKLAVCELLDQLGVSYLEGGWPGSNPRDENFFKEASKLTLKNSKITSFGSTRHFKNKCHQDPNLLALVRSNTPVITIFGKSWKFHVEKALGISLANNLEIIEESISYLKPYTDEIIFDAEHFFDGFADDEEYALNVLKAAVKGGADWVVLCDTNGGNLSEDVKKAVKIVKDNIDLKIGVHMHNDSELAVANSLVAVNEGATMIQGTINGYGERCGNANLVSIIPNLYYKMKMPCLYNGDLTQLKRVAHTVDELANCSPKSSQPFVGRSAFAHKGGVHVNAVMKNNITYEHITPESVGNHRRILISDLSGKSNILFKGGEYGLNLKPDDPKTKHILDKVKALENMGYQFEGAEASFRLLADEVLGKRKSFFSLKKLNVKIDIKRNVSANSTNNNKKKLKEDIKLSDEELEKENGTPTFSALNSAKSVASISMDVGGVSAETTSEGNGPIHAIDMGLRKLTHVLYPSLKTMRLLDYKVRVLSSKTGTEAVIRVMIRSKDNDEVWGTVGVSSNIIEASYMALSDAFEYKLVKDNTTPH